MTKINQEEYEILKELDDKYKWIVRDELLDEIKIFSESPTRHHKMNYWTTVAYTHLQERLFGPNLFQFIQWEDEEPYNTAELIEEYEIENGMRLDFGKIKVVDIDTGKLAAQDGYIYVNESEEEEVKGLDWLRKEVHKKLESWYGVEGGIDGDGINEIMLLIN